MVWGQVGAMVSYNAPFEAQTTTTSKYYRLLSRLSSRLSSRTVGVDRPGMGTPKNRSNHFLSWNIEAVRSGSETDRELRLRCTVTAEDCRVSRYTVCKLYW